MSENNKAVVRRLVEEVWNKGNLSVANECFASSYKHHDPSTPEVEDGPAGEMKRATLYRTAFPDLRLTIEDLIAEENTVAARWSCRGTHKGVLGDIEPTGKQVSLSGVSIVRFADGKMLEGWINWDALGMLQQLGVVPELAKA
jgi:steroid delta-isomerase-like uncharacterized protein